ncbi:MAG: UbiA family prenyltransferase [Syntrophales bacterium LBB04]|nr:UbiA family prenyltransferase [Syntrophales bacterium LBB04]
MSARTPPPSSSSALALFKNYLVLARIQTAMLTAVTPLIGALVMWGLANQEGHLAGHTITQVLGQSSWRLWALSIQLLLMGVLVHIYGFVLNEYIDYPIDRRTPQGAHKPLVTRVIPLSHGFYLPVLAAGAALVWLSILTGFDLQIIVLFLASLGGALIYDLYGKRVPLMDIPLALWAFLFCLVGALAALTGSGQVIHSSPATWSVLDIPWQVVAVSALAGLQVWFNNSVEGGIKDAGTDRRLGVKTLAVVMGVGWSTDTKGREQRLTIPLSFKLYAIILKAAHLCILAGLTWSFTLDPSHRVTTFSAGLTSPWTWIYLGAVGSCALINIVTVGGIISNTAGSRARLFKTYTLHEVSTFFLTILVIMPVIGAYVAALLIFGPLLWFLFFNWYLYGTPMNPKV